MSKGGSKLVTGIISFLLGFIFAILVEIGAVFGVYWFVMNKDINTVLAIVGIDNEDDKYINTDPDNGGVTNLKELISGVKGLVFEDGELAIVGKSFDEISNLIPATQMLLNTFYGIVGDYIEIDPDEFESSPLMNLAQVLNDSILNLKMGVLYDKMDMENNLKEDAKPFIRALLAGAECDYATVVYADGRESTLKLPVMCDYYMLQAGSLARVDYNGDDRAVGGISAFPDNLRDNQDALLTPAGTIEDEGQEFERYAVYYVPCKVTASGIEEAEYITDERALDKDGNETKFRILKYGEDTDFIAVEYNNGEFEIDFEAVYASLNADSEDASDRFTGYSYYENYAREYYYFTSDGYLNTVSGKNYFRDNNGKAIQLDALTLYDIMSDPMAPLEALTVGEVLGLNDSASGLLGAIKDTPLNRLEARINELTVGDIVEEEELGKSAMLRQLKNKKISELSTAIDELYIQMVYAKEVYGLDEEGDPAPATEYNADWLYYVKDADGTFVLANAVENPPADDTAYDDALGHIDEDEFNANKDTYYTYGGATGMWRIVLYKSEKEKAYTMNNFNNMVASCAQNVYKATLYELQEADIIDGEKDLSKTFDGTELGDMTLEELINMVLNMPST